MSSLRDLKSLTYALLDDASQQAVNFGIIVGYLNIAQDIIGNLLWNVDREKFMNIDTQSATNGVADYPTPSDLRELVRVVVNTKYEYTRFPARDLNALNQNTLYRSVYPNQMWYSEKEGSAPGKTIVRLFPTPATGAGAGSSNLDIWYYRRPMPFHVNGTQDGVATSSGSVGASTSTLLDTGLVYNTTATGYTDFWKYAQVRLTSGNNAGRICRLVSQTLASSTLTLDVVLPTATATSDTYEIDQMSILPEYTHYLMPYYAAGLAASKVGKDGTVYRQYFFDELEQMRQRLVNNVEINIPGEVSQGVQRARA